MKKHTLAWKSGLLCVGTAFGLFFGQLVNKKKDMTKIEKRIIKNIGVIEQYMDKKYGKGFFKERVLRQAAKIEILNELEAKEHSLDYVSTTPTR